MTTTTNSDPINWDIIRYYISRKVEEFLVKNRNNHDDIEISQLCRNIDIDGKQTSPFVDVLVDLVFDDIYKYSNFQEIKSQYTLKRRIEGRANINHPAPSWLTYERENSIYEIAETHDGILSSDYILQFLKEFQDKKLKGLIH